MREGPTQRDLFPQEPIKILGTSPEKPASASAPANEKIEPKKNVSQLRRVIVEDDGLGESCSYCGGEIGCQYCRKRQNLERK